MSFSVRDHDKQKSPQMFDRIAPTYDLVNRLLSFRLDISWRRKVGSLLPIKDRLQLLDLATGTGDLVIDLCNNFPDRIATAFGVDLSENMLQIGRKKIEKNGLKQKIQMQVGDAMALSMEDQTFDVVTISFGIRGCSKNLKGNLSSSRTFRQSSNSGVFDSTQSCCARRSSVLSATHTTAGWRAVFWRL